MCVEKLQKMVLALRKVWSYLWQRISAWALQSSRDQTSRHERVTRKDEDTTLGLGSAAGADRLHKHFPPDYRFSIPRLNAMNSKGASSANKRNHSSISGVFPCFTSLGLSWLGKNDGRRDINFPKLANSGNATPPPIALFVLTRPIW